MDTERAIAEIERIARVFALPDARPLTRTTSRLRIEDTTKGSRLAHGFGFGSGKGFAADLKLGCVRFEQNRPFHSNDPDGLRQWTAIDPS
jgi:hypothetical protein